MTRADTASEALAVSLGEKAGVDLAYVTAFGKKRGGHSTKELAGVIFQNPVTEGNRRRVFKRERAGEAVSGQGLCGKPPGICAINVTSLEGVQPKELDASEIEVRIGATWISTKYIEDFMRETFETPEYLFDRKAIGVQYSNVTGQLEREGKNADREMPLST